jgi:chloramphenicol O-acetyltransferase
LEAPNSIAHFHHGLADGYHLGLFFNRIQALLNKPAELFEK